jgi:hypothetical protein
MPTLAVMKVLLWFVLAVMWPSWSWARLGETPEQCEERYGAPIPNKDDFGNVIPRELPTLHMPRASVLCYHAKGLKILIVFTDGKAGQIFYQKLTKSPSEVKALSEAEINWLLEANSGGKTWEGGYVEPEVPRLYTQSRWTLSDQSASAVYEGQAYDAIQDSKERCFLLITTTEFRDAQEANMKADKLKNPQGPPARHLEGL